MIIRAIKAILTVDASQYERAMKQATGATVDLDKAGEKVTKSGGAWKSFSSNIRENSQAWDEISNKSMVAGAAIVAGLGFATKAAMSWESAFAGVRKTTEATEDQYRELELGLRSLAKILPATHEEIAGVGEAAGQLGVQRENIIGFTKVMIDMGEATNLSADEAATAMARFANVMGTSQNDFSNIGSSIVALGNNFATTEREIMDMASRLSGAGRQANMTEGDVLGIAAAMSSVGIEAQAGGTAMSRVMIEMGKSVDLGNEKLDAFARTAGMSTDAFSRLWRENAGEALTEFIAGLGRLQESGESLEPILGELGMTDIRVGDALRRSASSSDLFAEAMRLSNEAYIENNALAEEAAQRYETAESKLAIARNTVKDAAIEIGGALAPVVVRAAEAAAGLAEAFSNLPKPVQQAVAGIGAVAGGGLLMVGMGIKAIRTVQDLGDAFSKIATNGPRAAKGVEMAGTAARRATGFFIALAGAAAVVDFETKVPGVDELTRALISGGDAATILNGVLSETSQVTGADYAVKSLGDALQVTFEPGFLRQAEDAFSGLWEAVGGTGSSEIRHTARQLEALDQALTQLFASGNEEQFERVWRSLTREAEATGFSVEQLKDALPGLSGAMAAQETQAMLTADASGDLGDEMSDLADETGETADQAAEAARAFDQMLTAITMLGGGLRAEQAAASKVRDTLSEVTEAVKDGNLSWHEKEAILAGISDDYLRLTSIQAENGRSQQDLTATVEQGRDAFIKAARDLGYNAEAAEALADAYGLLPDDVQTLVEAVGVVESTAEVLALDDQIRRLDGKIVTVEEEGAKPSKGRVLELDGSIFGLKDKTVEVKEIGSTASGERVVELDGKIYRLQGKTVDISVNDRASSVLNGIASKIAAIKPKQVTVGVNYVRMGETGFNASGGLWDKAGSLGMVRAYKSGGMLDGTLGSAQPQVRPYGGPRGLLWGEEGSGPWEAFISGHPGKRDRSLQIWQDVGRRLGAIEANANGSLRTYSPAMSASTSRAQSLSAPARLDPRDIDLLADRISRGVERGAYRGVAEIGRGL